MVHRLLRRIEGHRAQKESGWLPAHTAAKLGSNYSNGCNYYVRCEVKKIDAPGDDTTLADTSARFHCGPDNNLTPRTLHFNPKDNGAYLD